MNGPYTSVLPANSALIINNGGTVLANQDGTTINPAVTINAGGLLSFGSPPGSPLQYTNIAGTLTLAGGTLDDNHPDNNSSTDGWALSGSVFVTQIL